MGATRNGNVAAGEDVKRLEVLREAPTAAKNIYWAGQTDFQIKTVNAWIAFAEQRNNEAVPLRRTAAEASRHRQAAADYYAKLQALAADRDTERPELTQAKTFLARR